MKYVCEVLSQSVDKATNIVCESGVARVKRNFPVSCMSHIHVPIYGMASYKVRGFRHCQAACSVVHLT